MDPKFDIEPELLRAHYLQLARQLHPDRYAAKSEREQEYSKEHSSRVNEAMSTLTDGVRRSRHLLETRGVRDDFDQSRMTDMEFLSSILDVRQQVDDAAAAADEDRLRVLLDQNQQVRVSGGVCALVF